MEGNCLQLALEGERLCKSGDCVNGVQFFEAAVKSGTDDLKVLSAIYSQLGNAYFYLQQYEKAFEFHKSDLNLTRTMADQPGEAKASGNLGNTLKVLGRYDEAIVCCERHLDLAKTLDDKVSEARALYNLGNVYHTKAKHMGNLGSHDPGEFPEPVRDALLKAVDYYLANLDMVRELGDRAAEGRAAGNLGNTFYLLGNFTDAITYHQQRLAIGKEFGDKAAERRAYSNLGNAHIFLGEFEKAIEYYKKALQLARQLGDLALEAQACYSLGNTYTLLREYHEAIDQHSRHLQIAKQLHDKLGQGRAYWSLSNAHAAIGNTDKALQYSRLHLEISAEIGDSTGQQAAHSAISQLREKQRDSLDKPKPLNLTQTPNRSGRTNDRASAYQVDTPSPGFPPSGSQSGGSNHERGGTLGSISSNASSTPGRAPIPDRLLMSPNSSNDEDSFFDLLSKFQGRRLDDQRTSFKLNPNPPPIEHTKKEQLMDIVAGVQGSRINEQRANFPGLRGANNREVMSALLSEHGAGSGEIPDDRFFSELIRCQGTRIEEQRTTLPRGPAGAGPNSVGGANRPRGGVMAAPTVPDEDFFSMITRLQSNRLDEQRYEMKGTNGTANHNGPSASHSPSSSNRNPGTSRDSQASTNQENRPLQSKGSQKKKKK